MKRIGTPLTRLSGKAEDKRRRGHRRDKTRQDGADRARRAGFSVRTYTIRSCIRSALTHLVSAVIIAWSMCQMMISVRSTL